MPMTLNYWTRRSPFFEAARRAGCKGASVANHMYQPHSYDDPVTEYWHLINGVTLWDVGTERQVEIAGPDAAAFVDRLTPRDVTRVAPGKCRYIMVTSEEGGIVNDPVMLRLVADRYWLSSSDSDLLLWAKGIAVHAGMDVRIEEPDVSPVQVQGPKSKAVIGALFGEAVAGLAYYTLVETTLDDIPVVVTHTGWSGEFGYEVFLRDSRFGDALWDRILEAGNPTALPLPGHPTFAASRPAFSVTGPTSTSMSTRSRRAWNGCSISTATARSSASRLCWASGTPVSRAGSSAWNWPGNRSATAYSPSGGRSSRAGGSATFSSRSIRRDWQRTSATPWSPSNMRLSARP